MVTKDWHTSERSEASEDSEVVGNERTDLTDFCGKLL